MLNIRLAATIALALAVFGSGCREAAVYFPQQSLEPGAAEAHTLGAYDTNNDGRANFFTFADDNGRVTRIGYDNDGDTRADVVINLDDVPTGNARHLVILLDGIGYDLAREYYEAGGLRMLHPPARVIAPYPTLTDLCMEDFLGYVPCDGFESEYFDRKRNGLAGGAGAYLRGDNAPYNRLLQYRADLVYDAIGYVFPRAVYRKEINEAKRVFDAATTQEVLVYLVSSAGVGTQSSREGHRECLQFVDRLVNQVVLETRGLVRITLMADHGHSYTPAKRIPLEEHLQSKGWRLRESLRGPKDVVYIRFGLETYASFATDSPAALAADLAAAEGVTIASYADGQDVVVLGRGGTKAKVTQKDGRFGYDAHNGDPLKLADILASLAADADGLYDAEQLLQATATHEYPAPLQRLWRAHFALVANPPDVIISLEDRFFSGAKSFAGSVDIASTHGGLNYRNSVTFIMSTVGPLPPVMQSADVPRHMKTLLGVKDWPMRK